ncbi:MAG: phosphoglucomutase/phosphomannomutase family protein [Hydrogenothermaceae bacterium]|nr:phosphoglucomutase/phosphomannomutase family protein [Hydrogenothermaceae bacterium]
MIKFGTDGFRGVIGDNYTFENLRKIAQAHVDSLKERKGKKVVIGYDTRFMSRDFALVVAEVFSSNGFEVVLSKGTTTTPALSFAVKHLKFDEGVIITASHNGYRYNGYKIKAKYGGPATEDIVKDVESKIGKVDVKTGYLSYEEKDLQSIYIDRLKSFFDPNIFKQRHIKLVHDPMYATSANVYNRILEDSFITIESINNWRDPYFGGHHPEPIDKNLSLLKAKVLTVGADVGIANDGDSDRVGIVDENGSFISTQVLYALLLLHTVRNRNEEGSIVKTVSTTYLADRIAEKEKRKIHKTPVGFKHVADIMLKEKVAFGGEESGGYGFGFHIPERDGILSGLLILEMMNLYSKSISEIVKDLFKEFGEAHYRREDLKVEGNKGVEFVKKMKDIETTEFAGFKIREIDKADGVKVILEDDSWILFRASGTEPVLRIYAEAPSTEKVDRLIDNSISMVE